MKLGLNNINIDLMYAFPKESMEMLNKDLDFILDFLFYFYFVIHFFLKLKRLLSLQYNILIVYKLCILK